MNLLIQPYSQTPIYLQLEDQLRQNILSGALSPGDALPSIRGMSKELGIGIITVKRAYDDLTAEGLLVSLQGRGVFVAQVGGDRVRQIRMDGLKDMLWEVRRYCETSAISREETFELLHRIYEEDSHETGH